MNNKFKLNLLGADPEIFVFDTNLDDFVSIEGMIKEGDKGTKKNPLYIKEGFGFQEDGLALEWVIPPTSTKQEFIDNNMFMLEAAKIFLPENIFTKVQTSHEFNEGFLNTEQAMIAGCEPSLNAWEKGGTCPPEYSFNRHRAVGGHLHCSYDNPDLNTSAFLIKKLDLILGVPSILFDQDTERRKLGYGRAGDFREKSYGFEYRSPSNFWLKSEEMMSWVYDKVQEAFAFDISEEQLDEYRFEIEDAINNSNLEQVYKLNEVFNLGIEKIKV